MLFKILRTDWMLVKYPNKYLPPAKIIEFNQTTFKFEMND